MRDENKRVYYIAPPNKDEDEWGTVFHNGYAPLSSYTDLVNENALSEDTEKFGIRSTERVQIVHDDNDGELPNIAVGYAAWLEEPTPDENEVYQTPHYIVDSVQSFGRKHVYILKRAVDGK
jgi:hypothetical protein